MVYIYKLTNLINGKIYIGQTVQSIEYRWSDHIRKAKYGLKFALCCAIRKYSENSFKLELVDTASSMEELNQKEIQYIKDFNSLAPNGYNLMSGGDNSRHSDESKRKMSQASKGQVAWNKGLTKDDLRVQKYIRKGKDNHRYGKPGIRKGAKLSKETRRKISEAQKGSKLSNETKQKMSNSHKNTLLFAPILVWSIAPLQKPAKP